MTVIFGAIAPGGVASDKNDAFEGTVSATLSRGGSETTRFLFTRKGNQVRIENIDKTKFEPINIVDLAAGKLTIVFPHNSSFVRIDLTRVPVQPGAPSLPPGFPAPPDIPLPPQAGARPEPSMHQGAPISPPPGFPTPPPMPSMPQMPNPAAAGPMPPPFSYGVPGMPAMPPMPGPFGSTPELKKTNKTRKIQGFECTCYTITDRMESFEIWATSDAALFPFRLLWVNYNTRHFGPRMLEEQWVELLQKKSLFPLEATLKMQNGGPDRFTFKVDKIERKKIDDSPELFSAPKNYYEIQPPPF